MKSFHNLAISGFSFAEDIIIRDLCFKGVFFFFYLMHKRPFSHLLK